jgi:hypothetical protein
VRLGQARVPPLAAAAGDLPQKDSAA